MRKKRNSGIFSPIIGLLFFTAYGIFIVIGRSAAQQTTEPGITKKTLPRKYDIIVASGESLGRFDGIPIKNISLLALNDGELSPIPFQIDERDRKGQYVMTHGKTARSDDDNGELDSNDELVFLGKDSGDRLPEENRLDGGNRIEIELADPRYPDRRAWVYLARYDGVAPRSKPDYVSYNSETEQIISDKATVGYRKGFMFYNDLTYPASYGGNGKDFLDRLKLRFRVDFFGGRVPVVRNEDVVSAEVQGWIDGPVRVIQLTQNRLKLVEKLPSIGFNGLSEYYPHMMSTPILVEWLIDPSTLKLIGINKMKAEIVADLSGMVGGHAYSNLKDINGYEYTGHTPQEELDKLDLMGIVWGYATKKGVGTWFPRLIFPDPMYQFNELYMSDNIEMVNPPDDVPGEIGSGLRLDVMLYPPEISKFTGDGSFELRFETYYAPVGLTPEGAREWLDIRDYPLFVDIHGGDSPTPPAGKKATGVPPWKGGRDGVITDTRDRKIPLAKMAYFIGSIEVDPRLFFPGERLSDRKFLRIGLGKIRSLANRIEKYEPVTRLPLAMFTKVTLTDGSCTDLLSCKMCGWAGMDETGHIVYLRNSQIKRVDF